MKNFLEKNKVVTIDEMIGKEVYFSIFPDNEEAFVYKGKFLGYGAYGKDPEHKTFCIYVERGDGSMFVDYFSDNCFKSKDEYEQFVEERKKRKDALYYSVEKMIEIAGYSEKHIPVKVKLGTMVYPICGIREQHEAVDMPAFVLEANLENGEPWVTD